MFGFLLALIAIHSSAEGSEQGLLCLSKEAPDSGYRFFIGTNSEIAQLAEIRVGEFTRTWDLPCTVLSPERVSESGNWLVCKPRRGSGENAIVRVFTGRAENTYLASVRFSLKRGDRWIERERPLGSLECALVR